MNTSPGLLNAAEGTGITRELSEHVNLLGTLLGQVIAEQHGPEMLELVEDLRLQCKKASQEGTSETLDLVSRQIATLDLETIKTLLKAYTDFFHLVNKAEQREIIRINRARATNSSPEAPRKESIAEAIYALKQQDTPLAEVLDLIQRVDIQPTLTAHPTEARRRSVMAKQKRISLLLAELQQRHLTPEEDEHLRDEIQHQIQLLAVTDEVRVERLTVQEEVDNGLFFIRNTIWQTLPRIYDDVAHALATYYQHEADLPPFLKFRSWIGSDRDGNPFVTPEVTLQTAVTHRRTALQLFLEDLQELRRVLSLSSRKADLPVALAQSIQQDAEDINLPEYVLRLYTYEPYRLKLCYILARIQRLIDQLPATPDGFPEAAPEYTSQAFIEDLELIRDALRETGFADIANKGLLHHILIRARAFGFHMAAHDIRQHSRIHEQAIASLLHLAGVSENYLSLNEEDRLAILTQELNNPRPLLPTNAELPALAREVLDTFEVIKKLIKLEPRCMGSYIISMNHSVSDMLEVMLIAKEVGLWSFRNGEVVCPIDIVPLFETIEDLEHAEALMDQIFKHEVYATHLKARGNFQEIMLGYSDSNKDGGYWMANWALHKGQASLGRVCKKHGIDSRLFHGRGGTVGRGGGRANQAISAMPAVCHNGRIRFTEQGEVISFRYATPDIAHRHLEQIVHAIIVSAAQSEGSVEHSNTEDAEGQLMESISTTSMASYRTLIDNPDLWAWYIHITPIAQISRLPIASRPVSRKSADEVDFDSLRAIPWGFAWTQTRYTIPGWYGIGQALAQAIDNDPEHLTLLQNAYSGWNFFRTVLNNAQLEMARARFSIAWLYNTLHRSEDADSFHDIILNDFQQAVQAILKITGQKELFEYSKVLRKSIALRNPYTDVLNLLQIELLKRFRDAKEEDKEELGSVVFLSINGIAAAMQSTG